MNHSRKDDIIYHKDSVTTSDNSYIGKDVVRCRVDDDDLLPDDDASLTLDPAVLLTPDLTLPCRHNTTPHYHYYY